MNQKKVISFLRDWLTTRICRKKIRKIIKHLGTPKSSKGDNEAYLNRWRKLQKNPISAWTDVFTAITGNISTDYIAEDVYYTKVEPVLNFRPMSQAETCKALYHTIYTELNFPPYLAVNMFGVLYDVDDFVIRPSTFNQMLKHSTTGVQSIIAKPTIDSGGGQGIRKFIRNNDQWTDQEGDVLSFEFLDRVYRRDYILQHGIEQHEFFAQFNPSSVNTLRILTYRSVADEKIHILHTLLRVGKKGMVTDNQASGGFAIGVQPNGCLKSYGINKRGDKFTDINGFFLSDKMIVPSIDNFKHAAIRMAGKLKYSRLIGHDLTLDSQGRVIYIEVNNSNNEINFYQMTNGSLFGEFTDEIIEYCSSNPRSYCFDFSL